jgi:hypothetical protein
MTELELMNCIAKGVSSSSRKAFPDLDEIDQELQGWLNTAMFKKSFASFHRLKKCMIWTVWPWSAD